MDVENKTNSCPHTQIDISKKREIISCDNLSFPWNQDPRGYFLVKIEEDLIKCDMETLDKTLGVKTEELTDTLKETSISDEAKVSDKAIIGPGVQIKGKSVIEDGVKLYRTIVDNSTIRKDSKVTRSVVINSQTGINANIISSAVINSSFGDNSNLECARMENSKVAENLLMSAYGELNSVTADKSCRIGSSVSNATVKSNLMSMHMAGTVNNIEVLSFLTKSLLFQS